MRWGIVMKRLLVLFGVVIALVLGVTQPAYACKTPATRVGLLQAIHRTPHVCVTSTSATASIVRGVSAVGVHDLVGKSCNNGGPGCEEVWAYTGSDWGRLGLCSQDLVIYPTVLPGHLVICKGNEYTLIRSGPGYSYRTIGRVTANTVVVVDRLRLQLVGRDGVDGLGWYRIVWHGHFAWVASYRVASQDNGCSNWRSYWTTRHHR